MCQAFPDDAEAVIGERSGVVVVRAGVTRGVLHYTCMNPAHHSAKPKWEILGMTENFGLKLTTLCRLSLANFEAAKGSVCLSLHTVTPEIRMKVWHTCLSGGEFPAEITKLSTASRSEDKKTGSFTEKQSSLFTHKCPR